MFDLLYSTELVLVHGNDLFVGEDRFHVGREVAQVVALQNRP